MALQRRVLSAYNDSRFAGGLGVSGKLQFTAKLAIGVKALAGDGMGRYRWHNLPTLPPVPMAHSLPSKGLTYLRKIG